MATDLSAKASLYTEGFSAGVQQIRDKLNQLNTALVQNAQEIKKTNAEIRELEKEQKALAAEMKNGGTDEQKQKMQELADKTAQATARLGQLKTTQQELKGALRDTSDELAKTAQKAGDAGNSMQDAFKTAAEALKAAGIAAAVKEIYQAFADCVSIAMEFQATMSTVEALSGANAGEMASLTEQAKQLGASTKFTANEAAEAMSYMAMAGWDAQEMMSGMDGVLDLAAAAGEDLARTADIVTDNLTAFGLSASDAAHFSDVLATAATNSNTSVSIMGETFKQSASVAGALGYSVEDVATAVGLMANAGVKGSIAGTALKNTFNGLLDGVTLSAKAFGEAEISVVKADGTMKSFGETVEELRGYFDKMTEAERVMNAMDISGGRGYNGLLAILNATDEAYTSLKEKIDDCAGAAENMAKIKTDNLAGDVTLMNSAFDGLKNTIGAEFEPELRELVGTITDVVTGINDFAVNNKELVNTVLTAGAAFAVFVSLPSTISSVATAVKALVTGISSTTVALAALSAAVALNVTVWGQYMSTSKSVQNLENDVKNLSKTIENAKDNFEAESEIIRKKADEYEKLRSTENRTESQERRLASLAGELQEFFGEDVKVINEMTGEYNDLTASIEKYIAQRAKQIEMEALEDAAKEAKKKMLEIEQEMEKRQKEHAEAMAKANGGDLLASWSSGAETRQFLEDMKSLRDSYAESEAVFKRWEEAASDAYAESEAAAESLSNLGSVGARSAEDIAKSYDEAKKSVSSLVKETKTLSSAFAEQNENGGLSAETILSLADAGYAAAFAVDEETGAVRLDTQAYLELADAKLKVQKIDLEKQKAEATAAMREELNRSSTWTGGGSRGAELLKRLAEEEAKYDAQIMALDAVDLSKTTAGGSKKSGSKTTGSDKDEELEEFKEKRAKLKHEYDMGRKEKEDYYKDLGELYDEYVKKVKKGEDNSDMRSTELELYKYEQSLKPAEKSDEENYKTFKSDLDFRHNMGEVSEKEYYKRLKQLRDKYLEEGSETWKAATLAIHKYDQSLADEKAKEAKKQLEDSVNERINLIDEEIAAKKKASDAAIAAIDAETEARRRAKEDTDLQREMDAVNAQLNYSQLDDFSRFQLERKLKGLQDQKSERDWERSAADRKASINAQYDAEKEAAEAEKQAIKDAADHFEDAVERSAEMLDSLAEKLGSYAAALQGALGMFSGAITAGSSTVNNYSSTEQNISPTVNFAAQPLSIPQITQAIMDALRSAPVF